MVHGDTTVACLLKISMLARMREDDERKREIVLFLRAAEQDTLVPESSPLQFSMATPRRCLQTSARRMVVEVEAPKICPIFVSLMMDEVTKRLMTCPHAVLCQFPLVPVPHMLLEVDAVQLLR